MPKNRKMQNIIGTEHITDVAEAAIAAQAGSGNVVDDTTPQLGGNLDVNGNAVVSTANGNIELNPNGTGKVVFKGNATKGAGQFVLNCEQNSHGIVIKGPPHSAGASYTLTLPDTDGAANEVLKTDGSGNLDWVAQSSGGGGDTLPLFQAFNIDNLDAPFQATISNRFPLTSSPGFFNRGRDTASVNVSNDIILVSFVLDRDLALTKLGFRTSTSGDNQCQMAIYNSDSHGRPSTLISGSTVTAGVTSGGSTGIQIGTFSSALNLSKHTLYYAAIVNSTDGSQVALTCTNNSAPSVFHFSGSSDISSQALFLSNVGAAPLPSTIDFTSYSYGVVNDTNACVLFLAEH